MPFQHCLDTIMLERMERLASAVRLPIALRIWPFYRSDDDRSIF
jgi:hypothetical protein